MVKQKNLNSLVAVLALGLTTTLSSAPLFPDQSDSHWAKDAVAALAVKGLVEGYPDGTFKGDRAASRWETAMIVARLLRQAETAHSTFAGRTELDELRKLAEALRPELEALGLRITVLEESTSRLDKRVGELERITFYGSLDTRVVMQSFRNTGASDNDAGRQGAGGPGRVPYLNYTDLVGTRITAPLRPQTAGIIPTVDHTKGVALTSGTGFTSKAILGLHIDISPDFDAGVEFAAYSSQGDAIVDAYWGVSAPHLSNPFTADTGSPNVPYTRMVMNQFWMQHNPTKTKLVVGTVDKTWMDPMVYAGQANLGVFGPRRFPGYGFQVTGEVPTAERSALKWELLGTRFGEGVRFQGTDYNNYVLSGNLRYEFAGGGVGAFFSRMAEEQPDGTGQVVGLQGGMNVGYGASTGWTIRQWVNPPGYFVNQLPASVLAEIGAVPNTADPRPISGWSAQVDSATGLAAGAGNYGPQSQDTWGVRGDYSWSLGGRNKLKLEGRFAQSDYRPSRNSDYSSRGTALDLDLSALLLEGDLGLGLEFLRVEPDYQPSAWYGNVQGIRPVKPFNFTGTFHLYDSGKYPHNRTGLRLNGDWKFHKGAGKVWAKAAFLRQTETSLYNVRVDGGALGNLIPTNDVIGFAPGFVDTVFSGFAHPNIYGSGTPNSFTASLTPLENPRGEERLWEVGLSHRWADIGLTVQGSYAQNGFTRHTSLPASLGGSQNEVDISVDSANLSLAYELNKNWTLRGGVDWVHAAGHFDPAGLYNAYALRTGETSFKNIDSQQWIPQLGFDYALSENSRWTVLAQHYSTRDGVSSQVQPGDPALGRIGSTAHPFHWSGWQVSSGFQLDF